MNTLSEREPLPNFPFLHGCRWGLEYLQLRGKLLDGNDGELWPVDVLEDVEMRVVGDIL